MIQSEVMKSTEQIVRESSEKTIDRIIGEIPEKKIHGSEIILVNKKHKQILKDYYAHCKLQNDSYKTIVTKLRLIKPFLFSLKKEDMKKVNRADVERYINSRAHLNPATINLCKIHLKTFFRWIYKLPSGEYPEVVNWLENVKIKQGEDREILTRDEIKKILQVTTNLRDNCLISVLYDGGLRIGEVTNLRIKDILWDGYGCRIVANGKTGKRTIRLVNSVPILKQWLNKHPFKDDPEHAVFICQAKKFGHPLLTNGTYKIIETACIKAGIIKVRLERIRVSGKLKKKYIRIGGKRVHPHIFRHTKITELANEGFNEMDLRIFSGWNKRSNMPEVYLHNTEKSVDEKMCRKSGLINKEDEKKIIKERGVLKPRECPMCEEKNDVNNKFCFKCGQILDIKAIKDLEATKDSIVTVLHKDDSLRGKIIASLKDELKKQILEELGVGDGRAIKQN